MPHRSRPLKTASATALLLLSALLGGCQDSATCVFTTGCQGGNDNLGPPATFPENGQTILPDVPEIVGVFPSGTDLASTTPIVVVFSESMQADTVDKLVVESDSGFAPPFPPSQLLLAGGRLLVILPGALTPGGYTIRLGEGERLIDLTGQVSAETSEDAIGTFSVGTADPVEPSVVATYPVDASSAQGTQGPLFVFFDRAMDNDTVIAPGNFTVTAGGAPTIGVPEQLVVTFLPDPRVYLYESLDMLGGEPISFGTGLDVALSLTGLQSLAVDGVEAQTLADFNASFGTKNIEPPLSAAIFSQPMDGIGNENLLPGANELFVQVELDSILPDDIVRLTLFGDSTTTEPQTIALSRSVTSDGTLPVSFTLADIDLANNDGVARFGDGAVAFAFAVQRGSQTSAVTLLDVDTATDGIQDPVLDTVAPTLVELLNPGGEEVLEFRSDQRDLVLAGTADERLRGAFVRFDSAVPAEVVPVAGADDTGLFLAAATSVGANGIVAGGGPLAFEAFLYDEVFNASEVIAGVFHQRGAVGPTPVAGGGTIEVEVFDADTLDRLDSFRAFSHEDQGGGTFVLLSEVAVSGTDLTAQVLAAPTPADTLVTVEADGYGLFTFQGLDVDRISIPLRRTDAATALVTGQVTSTDVATGIALLDEIQKKVEDTRRPLGNVPTFDAFQCIGSPTEGVPAVCTFDVTPGINTIRPGKLGAVTFLGGDFLQPTFSAATLLRGFQLQVPRPATVGGDADNVLVNLDSLFDLGDPPVETFSTQLSGAFATGLVLPLDALDPDEETTGRPVVTVEGLISGLERPAVVGLGLAYDQGTAESWDIEGAFPQDVWEDGFYGPVAQGGTTGTITELYLRAEIFDSAGARAGQRVPVVPPADPADPPIVPSALFAAAVPTVTSAVAAGTPPAIDIDFINSLPDLTGQPGLYVVRVTDLDGRTWTAMTPDLPDGQATAVHLPAIAGLPLADPAAGLASGDLTCTVESYSWPTLDPQAFLFSDVPRLHEFFSTSAPVTFLQP
ncbi:MAG: Ig-like domain-containing protein [Planctomycetota bacterium]